MTRQTNVAPIDERMVTLEDGRTVSNYSEEFRHECECRAVLAMRDRTARLTFLNMVAKHRGQPAADKLRNDAERLFYARKNRKAAEERAAAEAAASPQLGLL